MPVSVFSILFLFLLTPVPCYRWHDQPFHHSPPVSVWSELICLQRWEHFLVSAPLVWSTAVRMPVRQNPLIYWTDMCCLPQHCCSVPQTLRFTFYSLHWSVNSSGWRTFPSNLIFIGCRETGADGIDTSPRPARMRPSPQSGQMLMMDSWSRFIVCWCSVRLLQKFVSVMPRQNVFGWAGLGRKMRKAGHEWGKNGEADLSCRMKRSCSRVNDSEWGGHQPPSAGFNGVAGTRGTVLRRGLSPALDLTGWQQKINFPELLLTLLT